MRISNGNFLDEDGNEVNLVELLRTGKATPVVNNSDGHHMSAHSGWFTDENGTPVNIVALIDAAIDEDDSSDEPAIGGISINGGSVVTPDENGIINLTISGDGSTVIDSELSTSSTNPVQNKVVAGEIEDLNEAVNAVNGSLSTLIAFNLGASATWTDGRQITKSSGNTYTNADTACSEYIDISGCSSILYMRRVANAASAPTGGMAFYDSSKTFITDSGVADGYKSGGGNPELHEEEVPEGAVYARFTYLRTDDERIADYPFEVYDADAYRKATAQTAKESKKNADDALTYIDGLIEAPSIAPLTGYNMEYDGYIASNGTSITSPTTAKERYTEYIPVEAGSLYVIDYKVKLETASNFWACYCKYDSEKAVVGSRTALPTPTLEDNGYYHSYLNISIPSTTAYLRVTARTYGDAVLTVYKYVNKSSEIQPSFQVMRKERAEEIAEAISGIDISNDTGYSVVYSPNAYDYVCRSINHRGYNNYPNDGCPENTIPAYRAAKTAGFYFVETDVRITSDGHFVLLHDVSINRTARNSDGTTIEDTVNIADITLETALTYDFGIFKGETYAGTKIPTLEEFLLYCKGACLHPYIEIKFPHNEDDVKRLVDVVNAYGMKDRVTYIAGSNDSLKTISEHNPTARLGQLVSDITDGGVTNTTGLRSGHNEVFICARNADELTAERITNIVNSNIGVELWCYDTNASYIISRLTNYPIVTGIIHNLLLAGKEFYDFTVGVENSGT